MISDNYFRPPHIHKPMCECSYTCVPEYAKYIHTCISPYPYMKKRTFFLLPFFLPWASLGIWLSQFLLGRLVLSSQSWFNFHISKSTVDYDCGLFRMNWLLVVLIYLCLSLIFNFHIEIIFFRVGRKAIQKKKWSSACPERVPVTFI